MSHLGRGRKDRPPRRRPPKGVTRPLPPIALDAAAPERCDPTPRPPEPPWLPPGAPASRPAADLWLVVVLLALAAVPFLPALSSSFVWEDQELVVGNPLLRSLGSIAAVFAHPFLSARPDSYHPLVTLTYLTDFQVWRLNPEGYHSTNLTLHLVATLLVYMVAMQLLRRRPIAFAAGAVFAVHPVHVQSVAWIAGRAQPLATCLALFALLAFGSYVVAFDGGPRSPGRVRAYYAASLGAFTLALFAHAAAAALIILLPLYEVALARARLSAQPGWRFWRPYAGFAAGVALYLAARWSALGYHLAVGFDLGAWTAHLYTTPLWAARAIELLLLPVNSQPYHPIWLAPSPLRPDVLTATCALAVVVAAAVRLRAVSPPAAFAVWWALLTLAPTLNLLPVGGPQFAERNLYLPSVGVAIFIGWAAVTAHDFALARGRARLRALIAVGFACVIALGMVATSVRSGWYRDDTTLFTRMVRGAPRLGLAHFNLGNAYFVQGDLPGAVREYELAIQSRPSAAAYHNLGNAYLAQGRWGEAAEAYRNALRLNPDAPATNRALAEALRAQRESEAPLQGAVEPSSPDDAVFPGWLTPRRH
ncbi:MAG TPA: tetratricopeptide repeat protein [Armatimonadota bacterium]|nr:tetratricopeptide repeat protein [Armatimonadota bacterium]